MVNVKKNGKAQYWKNIKYNKYKNEKIEKKNIKRKA